MVQNAQEIYDSRNLMALVGALATAGLVGIYDSRNLMALVGLDATNVSINI